MFIVYDLIFLIFAVLYFPYMIAKGKGHKGLWMRLGFFPEGLGQSVSRRKNIWIHAVSVGEVLAVLGLIEKMKADFPQHRIVLSTVTQTGYRVAQSRFGGGAVVIYAPFDFSWIVRRYIRLITPEIYIAAETEIWPNLFLALSEKNIPIVQINGRISDQGYSRYKRVRFLLKSVLGKVNVFCMQSKQDAHRIMALGARPQRVHVVGNIKFDGLPRENRSLRSDYVVENKFLWVAGSTHPGEEDIVLNIFKILKQEFPDLRLVIAPRHIERAKEVEDVVKSKGLRSICLSRLLKDKDMSLAEDCVVVVDKIGYLRSLYSSAKFVFVGKSLTVGGGQNIIEPAFFAKPILVGPLTQNFRSVVDIFLEAQAIIQVRDEDALLTQIRKLLKDPPQMQALGRRAQEVIQKHRGATAKTGQIISDLLLSRTKAPEHHHLP